VARYDILRTSFDLRNGTMTIHPDRELVLDEADMSGLSLGDQRARRDELHDAISGVPFDLVTGPVFRALLIQFSAERAELVLFVHHIACDGWSMGVLMRDLATLYSATAGGTVPALPSAPSIGDLVAAEAKSAGSEMAERHRAFWLKKYSGPLPDIDLPTDRPHPSTRSIAADRVTTKLNTALEWALRGRAQSAGASLRELVFAAFQFYLSRLTRTSDVVVGLPASGQLAHGLEGVVGHGVSLLPVRGRIEPDVTVGELVRQARHDFLEALDHQNYTYGQLMRDLNLPRDPSRLTLVPVVVNIDNLADLGELSFRDVAVRLEINPTKHQYFELFFNIFAAPGRVELSWTYLKALFDRETVLRHAENFVGLLSAIAAAPQGLEVPVAQILRGDTLMAIRLNSLSLQKKFSIRCRAELPIDFPHDAS
jgi:hypothetical protein